MGIPEVVAEIVPVVLRDPFGKPNGNDKTGERIGSDDVRITVEDIGPPFRFVSKPLEVDGGKTPSKLHRCLDLDDMRELMRDDVPEPVVRPPEFEIHARGIDLDLVVEEIRGAVGDIVVILDDEADFLRRLVIVERRHRLVHILCNLCDDACRPLGPVVVVDVEVLGLDRLPLQLRVVKILLRRSGECGTAGDHDRPHTGAQRSQEDSPHLTTATLMMATAVFPPLTASMRAK